MKKQKVIKTQEDLDNIREKENGMYYISMSGNVAMFNGKYTLTLLSGLERMEEIALGTSHAITEAMVAKKRNEAIDYIDVAIKTYLIPFRYH